MKPNMFFGIIFFIFVMISSFSTFASYDEGVYYGMSNYFKTGGEEGFYEALRPVGIPLFTMFFPTYWLARIAMLVLVGIILYSVYKLIPDEKTASWTIVLISFSPLFLKYSWHLMNDGIAYFMPFFSLYFIRKKPFIAGILLGIGFLLKFPIILSFIVLVFSLKRIKDITPFVLGLIIAMSPQFITLAIFNQGNFYERLIYPFLQASGIVKTNVWLYGQSSLSMMLKWFVKFYVMITAGIIVWIVWLVSEKLLKRNYELPKIPYFKSYLAIVLLYLVYFSFLVSRYDQRYLLSFLPFVAIIAARPLSKINNYYFIPLILLLVITPYWFESNPHDLSVDLEGDIITNTGYTMLYYDANIKLVEGIYIVGDYIDYKLSNRDNYIMSLFEYRCHNKYCEEERQNTINSILLRENITDCGYWHGHQIVVMGEQKISAEQCAEKINWELEPSTTASFIIAIYDDEGFKEFYTDLESFNENISKITVSESRYWEVAKENTCFTGNWNEYNCRKIFIYADDLSEEELIKAIDASTIGKEIAIKVRRENLDKLLEIIPS